MKKGKKNLIKNQKVKNVSHYRLPITDYPLPNLVENKEGNSGKKVT
jgi:hypothetical protein